MFFFFNFKMKKKKPQKCYFRESSLYVDVTDGVAFGEEGFHEMCFVRAFLPDRDV